MFWNCGVGEDPWTARRSSQFILKEISPRCSLEGLMLKLKLQYFCHVIWRTDSLEKPWSWERLRTGREGDDRGWYGWMASLTQLDLSLSKLQETLKDRAAVHGVAKSPPWFSNWTTTTECYADITSVLSFWIYLVYFFPSIYFQLPCFILPQMCLL